MGACQPTVVFSVQSSVVLIFHSLLFCVLLGTSTSDTECPVSTPILYAYPEGDTLEFSYEYDPFRTDISIIDNILTKVIDDDDVKCEWEIRAKEGHHAEISFPVFKLKPAESGKAADCLTIYDGNDEHGTLLDELCGQDLPEESYDASDRSLFIVYVQGQTEGHRLFELQYSSRPRSKAFIVKIAGIVSGVIAAVVVCFLAYKFSHSCKPCRKRCCPDIPADETLNQRELHPLTPQTVVPPSAAHGREDNLVNEELAARESGRRSEPNGDGANVNGSQGARLGPTVAAAAMATAPLRIDVPDEDVDKEEEHSPLPDEPPPSYDSIFGDSQEDIRK